jgi:transcriptional regulator with XRE-family HTH domain
MSEIPARLRAARAYAELSQPELAERIQLGEVTYAKCERGQRAVPRRELLAIAEACGVPMWFLEGGWDGWRGDVEDAARQALEAVPPRRGEEIKRRRA